MHKITIKTKKLSVTFLNLLVIILLILSLKPDVAYGIKSNWTEISKTEFGIQYLDKDSLTNKEKGVIEIKTKYLRMDINNAKKVEENIYIMRINCINNRYKDISVNGNIKIGANWEDPNGDKLINDVITESCKNVKDY